MSKVVTVLHPPKPARREAADMRTLMDQGSLNLRGIAAMLHRLEDEYEGVNNDDSLAMILRVLAQDVDREAEAMGDCEGFLLSLERAKKKVGA
jgi:hypothetical protein